MERLTRPDLNVDPGTDRFLSAKLGGKEIDWKQCRDSTLNVLINGPTSNGFCKDIFRKMVRDLYGRLKAYEDTGLTPEDIKAAFTEDVVIKLAAQAVRTEPGRLRELAEADRLVREMEWRSDKYINYTAAREKACKGCTSRDGTEGCYSMEPCEHLIAEIICAPAADVAPVHYAHWEEVDWREYDTQSCEIIRCPKAAIVCSDCRNAFKKGTLRIQSFCPACGARMDGAAE